MSTSTWGEPEPVSDETYPQGLLKHLLKQMMLQFGADGACIALYDEYISQMRVHAHVRLAQNHLQESTIQMPKIEDAARRRETINLVHESRKTTAPRLPAVSPESQIEIVDVEPEQCELFAVGSIYPRGRDLIGLAWQRNQVYALHHDDYLSFFHARQNNLPLRMDVVPLSYLVVPVVETTWSEGARGRAVLGVLVLYQLRPELPGLLQRRLEVEQYVERIALHLQNSHLQQKQRRTSEYLKLLQGISMAFPNSVKLSDLVENLYQFTQRVVDVSAMVLTLYDRDHDRLYDVFAVRDGQRIVGLSEQPLVRSKEERPIWWRVTQRERRSLSFSPAQDAQKVQEFQELLMGVWGDQRSAESFLLLPMKMFTRVIGSLSIASARSDAYHSEEIQVLETMTQIVTVSIENAKLYERDRRILHLSTEREVHLAAINNILQSITSVLNVTELLNNLVESVATTLKVDVCVFLQPVVGQNELVVQALHAPSSVIMYDDGSGMPEKPSSIKGESDKLITMIQVPFKETFLEQRIHEGFFYLDSSHLEELAQKSQELGQIFWREIGIHYMLVIPLNYQKEFLGFLGVPIPEGSRIFRPKDVGTLLAICAQAAGAIRNAQLFEQREVANAEMERMSKLKDEFLVTASHELRTPLTAIHGYASQLKRQANRATPQQILRATTRISMAAQQLTYLLDNMTEAANIGVMDLKQDLQIEPVQLRAAGEIAVNMLTLRAEHEVTLDIAPDVWITGDGPRVRQVLTNLLENAAKYSPPNTPVLVSARCLLLSQVESLLTEDQIDPTLLLEKGDIPVVLVRITDQGEGVLLEDQSRIFDKFVRAPRSLTTPVRGTGLGLYICRRFVEAMGGKLWLEHTVPHEGSIFSFYLPWVKSPLENEGE